MSLATILSNTTAASDIGAGPVSILSATNTLNGIAFFTLRFTALNSGAQELTIAIRRGGNYLQTLSYSIPDGETSAEIDLDPIRIGTGQAIAITVESDNASDTAVICTADGVSAEPLQPATRGRDLAVDASGDIDAANMVAAAPALGDIKSGIRTELAPELARIDQPISDPATLTGDYDRAKNAASAAELSATESTLAGLVNAINTGAARYVAILTAAGYEIPDAGDIDYPIEIRTFDANGDPVAIDAAADPAVTITATDTSTDLSAGLSAITNPATGVYRLACTVAFDDTPQPLRIDAAATIAATARSTAAHPVVTDAVAVDFTDADRTALNAIRNKLPTATYLTGTESADGSGYSTHAPADTKTAIETDGGLLDTLVDRLTAGRAAKLDRDIAEKSDTDAIVADTTTIKARLSATVTQLFADLVAMIVGSGSTPKFTTTALSNAPSGGGGGGSTLTGPNAVALTITDDATGDPIEGALVRLTRTGESGSEPTDVDGLATFAAGSYTWTVLITAAGYESHVATLAVDDDVAESYALTPITIAEPPAAGLCTVYAYVRKNGQAIEGARLTAQLVNDNSAADGALLDLAVESATTDANGYAELTLVQLDQFTAGDGVYQIEVKSGQRKITSIETTIPNASTANVETLVSTS